MYYLSTFSVSDISNSRFVYVQVCYVKTLSDNKPLVQDKINLSGSLMKF